MLHMGYPGTMLESWDQGEKLRVYRDGKEKCRSPAWHPTELWEVDKPRNKNPPRAKRPAELILEEQKQ